MSAFTLRRSARIAAKNAQKHNFHGRNIKVHMEACLRQIPMGFVPSREFLKKFQWHVGWVLEDIMMDTKNIEKISVADLCQIMSYWSEDFRNGSYRDTLHETIVNYWVCVAKFLEDNKYRFPYDIKSYLKALRNPAKIRYE